MARPIWTGYLSFGLVNVAVGLYSAIRDRCIHFTQLHKEIDPIYFQQACYLGPRGRASDRAYSLLRQAMHEAGREGNPYLGRLPRAKTLPPPLSTYRHRATKRAWAIAL